jgi:hypothetical protein
MSGYIDFDPSFYEWMNSPYMREVIPCGCGVEIQRRNIVKHDQTIRHQAWEKDPEKFFNKQLVCKCGLKYAKSSEDEHRKSKEHKEMIRQQNLEHRKIWGKQTITCECGSVITNNAAYSHKKSDSKHQEWLKNK